MTAVCKSLCWVLSRRWATRASVCAPGEGRSIRWQGKPVHWAHSTKSISPRGNCWGLLELNTWSVEERVTWEVTEGYRSISLLYLILRNWVVCLFVFFLKIMRYEVITVCLLYSFVAGVFILSFFFFFFLVFFLWEMYTERLYSITISNVDLFPFKTFP